MGGGRKKGERRGERGRKTDEGREERERGMGVGVGVGVGMAAAFIHHDGTMLATASRVPELALPAHTLALGGGRGGEWVVGWGMGRG